MPLATRSACRLFERQRVLRTGRKNFQSSIFRSAFNLLKCLPHFVPTPPLLRSNACSYIVQGISTTRSRHPPERQQASRQSAAVFPTNCSRYSDKRRQVSPTPLPHTNQGGTLRVAALQSIMKPHFTPHLYLYLYIYKYIYKYKIFLWYLLLLGKQLQHCNAARNCTNY